MVSTQRTAPCPWYSSANGGLQLQLLQIKRRGTPTQTNYHIIGENIPGKSGDIYLLRTGALEVDYWSCTALSDINSILCQHVQKDSVYAQA